MPGTEPKTSFKDLVGVVRHSPALMIAGGVLIIVVIYLVYRNSKNANDSTNAQNQPGYFLLYNEVTPPNSTVSITDNDTKTPDTQHPHPMPCPRGQHRATDGKCVPDQTTDRDKYPECGGSTPLGGKCTGRGPGDINYYKSTGNQTLGQIANALGGRSATWNDIYAIPDNQKLFGKMDYKHARGYKPKKGELITIPAGW